MNLVSTPEGYIEIILQVQAAAQELAETVLLELGAAGTALSEPVFHQDLRSGDTAPGAAGRVVEVVGYFSPDGAPSRDEVLNIWRRLATGSGWGDDAEPIVEQRELPWRDWVTESRAAWEPFEISPELTIAPPWHLPETVRGDLLILNPGAAFGLGSHPTTRGCLRLIPPCQLENPGAVLDIGTGTGVLALRAAQCGYGSVVAFDNDGPAVEAARENFRLNDMEGAIGLFLGESNAISMNQRYALILANIFLNPLLSLAEELAARLLPQGHLIVSGIREADAPELVASLAAQGLTPDKSESADGWIAIRLRRAEGT
jgi:ribosomal protein L11 methyltransferase